MDPPTPPHQQNVPDFVWPNFADNAFRGPFSGKADVLSPNVPLKPNVNHDPVLSTRGAGVKLIHQAARAPVETVTLYDNNLAQDFPVPYRLLRQVPHSTSTRDEFTHIRYSAVNCDPANFYRQRFTLRPALFASPRTTEIMIVVTIYNEDDVLVARALRGVLANIKYLTSLDESPWGKSSWKKIVVCIMSDGRLKMHDRTKALLTLLGVYQERAELRSDFHFRGLEAHLYEYTSQMSIEVKRNTVKVVPTGAVPCQLLLCQKQKNQKKPNSHRWALQAFGSILNPKICIFVEAGTEPGPASFFHMWKAFNNHPTCGSVSGVTQGLADRQQNAITNPLLAAQHFQYELWNVLDRPFDSLLGLRFDMPGAMLAYRFAALQNDRYGDGPLNQYFRPEKYTMGTGAFTENMALTQERALSFALVTKRNSCWDLRYEHAAFATVDVPKDAAEYLSQQQRQFRDNIFGSIYAITHLNLISRSSHSNSRKFLLFLQCIYQTAALLFSWFTMGNLFLIFHILATRFVDVSLPSTLGPSVAKYLDFFYLGTLFLSFIFALGHSSGDKGFLFLLVVSWSIIMSILMTAVVGLGIAALRADHSKGSFRTADSVHFVSTTLVPLFLTYSFWLTSALISRSSPFYLLNSVIQYILLLPMRINILNLYAFFKIDEISTHASSASFDIFDSLRDDGADLDARYERAMQLLMTKNENKQHRSNSLYKAALKSYTRHRTLVVASWSLTNGILILVVLRSVEVGHVDAQRSQGLRNGMKFVGWVLWSFAVLTGIKFAGAMIYFTRGRRRGAARTNQSQKRKVI